MSYSYIKGFLLFLASCSTKVLASGWVWIFDRAVACVCLDHTVLKAESEMSTPWKSSVFLLAWCQNFPLDFQRWLVLGIVFQEVSEQPANLLVTKTLNSNLGVVNHYGSLYSDYSICPVTVWFIGTLEWYGRALVYLTPSWNSTPCASHKAPESLTTSLTPTFVQAGTEVDWLNFPQQKLTCSCGSAVVLHGGAYPPWESSND